MSLIRIRMDSTSFAIDGYEIGARNDGFAVCPISTWDQVRSVLDGFDIDQPARLQEAVDSLRKQVHELEQEVQALSIEGHTADIYNTDR